MMAKTAEEFLRQTIEHYTLVDLHPDDFKVLLRAMESYANQALEEQKQEIDQLKRKNELLIMTIEGFNRRSDAHLLLPDNHLVCPFYDQLQAEWEKNKQLSEELEQWKKSGRSWSYLTDTEEGS